jgi:hypothetical protein
LCNACLIVAAFLAAPIGIWSEQRALRELPPAARGNLGVDTPEEKRIENEMHVTVYGSVLVIARGLCRLTGARREADELAVCSAWFQIAGNLGIALWMLLQNHDLHECRFDVRPSFILAGLMLVMVLGDVAQRLREGRLTRHRLTRAIADAAWNVGRIAAYIAALFVACLVVTVLLVWSLL